MTKSTKPKPASAPAATASTTLTVTVFGGVAPEPIDITLYKDADILVSEQHPQSFSRTFTGLGSGSIYSLYIAGKNPLTPQGATKCELTTDEISIHPPDEAPALKKGKQYLVEFHFTV